MTSEEVRKSFLEFFREKNHAVVPSSSLIPDDPSVLLTTAGMQQFKRYYTGELDAKTDFGAARTASVQKCFRTADIDEVGDETHLTFFEMLGNFSFGDYFKEEAIKWAYEFVTSRLNVSPERVTVSVFSGMPGVPRDEESYRIWHKGVGISKDRISEGGAADNFWGPTGNGGPCGPTTEIHVDGMEVWNIVFNEFSFDGSREELLRGEGELKPLARPGVDTGMGFERLMAVLQGTGDVFETDLLHPLFSKVRELAPVADDRVKRVLTDHLRAAVFLIADGVRPSNKEAGYVLRRLLRRILTYAHVHDVHADLFSAAVEVVRTKFDATYHELANGEILETMAGERRKFEAAVSEGLAALEELLKKPGGKIISSKDAFLLYETHGLPRELIKEFAAKAGFGFDEEGFDGEFRTHQDVSRAGAEKKFGGHGLILNTGELKAGNEEELKKAIRLHTATHLLQQALREVLGDSVRQMGSDITAERTRFDFSFPRKMTPEEIARVEDIVNRKIKEDLPVGFAELPKAEAEKTGALFFFKEKYPEKVKVYFVGRSLESAWSKEFCGGPHVSLTSEIGTFRVAKEEAVGAGARRIRGVVEP